MRNAETVLGVLRERGKRRWPLERIYRLLYNPELYLLAYGRIYSNKGAMTPGVNGETADGMSMEKIERIIDALRHERYRFSPVRRVYIPKKNGKLRPLGMPIWSDKLVGEVVRLLLEAYDEPQFSGLSHGFRPDGGAIPRCGTWLKPGLGQPGSSKGTFPMFREASTTELWSILSRRRSTITGSSGLCGTCFRPDTWKTGFGARRSAGHRKAELFPRFCPMSTCISWIWGIHLTGVAQVSAAPGETG